WSRLKNGRARSGNCVEVAVNPLDAWLRKKNRPSIPRQVPSPSHRPTVKRPPEWNVCPNGPATRACVSPTPGMPLNCGELAVTRIGTSAGRVHHIRYSADVYHRPQPQTRSTAGTPVGHSPQYGSTPHGSTP